MAQIFGDFIEDLPKSQEYLIIGFSPSSQPLKKRWRNNGLSADFMADYLITFFPDQSHFPTNEQMAELKSAVSYIANELLENAMKYNDDSSGVGISIQLQLHANKLIFLATNSIAPDTIECFQEKIQELISNDPTDLYFKQIEANVIDDSNSGLGLLTMMHDYLAKIGWRFESPSGNGSAPIVTTMVQLLIS